jgi:hypothetical protein
VKLLYHNEEVRQGRCYKRDICVANEQKANPIEKPDEDFSSSG